MSIRDRDKKIILVVVPVLLIVGYWFLLLAPKREEAASLGTKLAEVQQKRDKAKSQADSLESSKESYAKDYATVVRLGKAAPSTLDLPSLIVQLDAAAKGTKIRFKEIRPGQRAAVPEASAEGSGSASGEGGKSAPGGDSAETGPGKASEAAGETAEGSNAASADAEGADTEGASSAAAGSDPAAGAVTGLDAVPLEFGFTGGFFELADFFHELKRFVHVSNGQVRVRGRLLTIDSFDFTVSEFPEVEATARATVYLAPKGEGTTADGAPTGPASGQPPTASNTAPVAPASNTEAGL